MVWQHRGIQIPVEVYHGIPEGWTANEIWAEHKALRGTYPIHAFEIGKWSAPSWMTQRYEWLRYRQTLYRVVEGVRAGDTACIEIAVRYIVLRYIGSYSGFVRAKLARSLKSATLTEEQQRRLNRHFKRLVLARDYTEEFRDYKKLWLRIIDRHTLDVVSRHMATRRDERTGWVDDLAVAFAAHERARAALEAESRAQPRRL